MSFKKFQMIESYEKFVFPEKYQEKFDKLTIEERVEIAKKDGPLYAGKDWDEVRNISQKLRLESFYILFKMYTDEELFQMFSRLMLGQSANFGIHSEKDAEDIDLFNYNAIRTRNSLDNTIEENRYYLNKALKRKLENKNGIQ